MSDTTCTHHNDQQRAACPVCLVAALTAERDQIRADCENETKWAAHYLAKYIANRERAEKAEAELVTAKKILNEETNRAEKAEAELAFQVARNSDLFTQRDDAEKEAAHYESVAQKATDELVAERARLDHVLRIDCAFDGRDEIDNDIKNLTGKSKK